MSSTPPGEFVPDLHGVAVLIVEDHRDTAEMYRDALEASGAAVRTAGSGAEALRLAEAALPHVIVSDIRMRHGDGFWLVTELRKLPGGMGVPVIGLSGRPLKLLGAAWKNAGFSVALMKPVNPFHLAQTIAKILTARGRRPAA